MTDRHGIGGNGGPVFEAAIDDLRSEAGNFLDGADIENAGQADKVGLILSEAKKLRADIDKARKEEKAPHLEAGKAVDAAYKPTFEKLDAIVTAAKPVLTKWLNAVAAQQAEQKRQVEAEAERAAQAAIEAERQSAGNLEATEQVTQLRKEAGRVAKEAAKVGKQKAHVEGLDRAIGLRETKVVTVTDHKAALIWIANRDKPALDVFIEQYAQRHARTRPMDGVAVEIERKVA